MLELSNLYSFYGSSAVLQGVDLEVGQAEVVSILGRNGVGKTTLLKTIMGLTDKTDGSIVFEGDDLVVKKTYQRAKCGIAYIPQGREIIPKFTVLENLVMGTYPREDGKRDIPQFIYDLFPVLWEMKDRKGGDLSGGQQQQLAIGRALAMSPKILLLDEPTEGIQPNIVEQIEGAILRLNEEFKLAIMLVEQNVEFARRASKKFYLFDKGRAVASGEIDNLTDSLVSEHMAV